MSDIADTLLNYLTEANIEGGSTRVPAFVLEQARVEIESLRALCGVARIDPGFREITGALPRRSSEPKSPKAA